jgi:hypothetical protein
MTVVIGNTPYAIEDWSLTGLQVLDYRGTLGIGESTAMRVLVPTAGPGALFRTDATVKRMDPALPSIGVAFGALDSIAFGTLNRYLQERLVRGHG